MRAYVGQQEAWNDAEFEELAYGFRFDEAPVGIDHELFLGGPGESPTDRATREAVAREVLAELRAEAEQDEIAAWDALYAEQLTHTLSLLRATHRADSAMRGTGDAA